MSEIITGQRVNSAEGPGEVVTIFEDKIVIKLDSGTTTTLPADQVESEDSRISGETDLSLESPLAAAERSEHARQIVDKLDHTERQNEQDPSTTQNSNEQQNQQQIPMENNEKEIEVINDLIKINNDRVAGFEKAGADLEGDDNGITPVFNKLAGESRQYAGELTEFAQQYGGDAAEGTSTSGDLHRAWIDIKSAFTGNDLLGILNECERGEDAAKSAYRDALDPQNALPQELVQVLQQQQQGITEGHDLIKSLRDQVQTTDNDGEDLDENANLNEPEYRNEIVVGEPSYEGTAGGYQAQAAYAPEPESIEQEQDWEEEQNNSTGNSKLMEFFVEELKDLLWAERELVETIPDMVEAATSVELQQAFELHLSETRTHVTRLEQIFGILGLEPDTRKCEAMSGILDEGDDIISATEEGTAQRDVGLIFAGQKVEHYEIASYGGMIALAKTLGYYEVAELLVLTLDEEKTADAKMTDIAEGQANYEASREPAEN